uniref:RNA-directed RNA polymerase L n=1 Tax=Rhizoctonia cerealis lentinuvirus TaxID=3068668 RepID=A0AA51BSC1_9VIRU|nr:MAG: RNA-dependent RNA polymerase [Rhizoctonia cerealis lentinuvirus]
MMMIQTYQRDSIRSGKKGRKCRYRNDAKIKSNKKKKACKSKSKSKGDLKNCLSKEIIRQKSLKQEKTCLISKDLDWEEKQRKVQAMKKHWKEEQHKAHIEKMAASLEKKAARLERIKRNGDCFETVMGKVGVRAKGKSSVCHLRDSQKDALAEQAGGFYVQFWSWNCWKNHISSTYFDGSHFVTGEELVSDDKYFFVEFYTQLMEFSIGDLLKNIPDSEYTTEGSLYEQDEALPFNIQVSMDNVNVFVSAPTSPGHPSVMDGVRLVFNQLSESLKNIRHEIVSSLCQGGTDIPFSSIDPNYTEDAAEPFHRLTPDYFNEQRRFIGELGTSASPLEGAMSRMFTAKQEKYSPYLSRCQISRYYIFIVSSRSVFTNYPIQQYVVDQLCMRCRFGLSAEAEITSLLGDNIFLDSESSESISKIRTLLLGLGGKFRENEEYDKSIFDAAKLNLSEEEELHVQKLLKETWKATRDIKKDEPVVMDEYMKSFDGEHSRNSDKRVCNFPFILSKKNVEGKLVNLELTDTKELPNYLRLLWMSALDKTNQSSWFSTEEIDAEEAKTPKEANRHRNRKAHQFTYKPDLEDSVELASRSGIGGRRLKDFLIDKEAEGHKGFSPDTPVKDIENYLYNETYLLGQTDEDFSTNPSLQLLSRAKEYSEGQKPRLDSSINILQDVVLKSRIVSFADMITDIMSEIAYALKHYTKDGQYIYKHVYSYNVGFIIHTAGEHSFVSFVFRKEDSEPFDTHRMGPEIFNGGKCWITDFVSYNKTAVEHYLKAGPYIASIFSHLLSTEGIDVLGGKATDLLTNPLSYKSFWINLKFILILYLNNKRDSEEAVTSSRYLYMNLLDEFRPNPYGFVERLPTILRSRLTVFIVKRLKKHMDWSFDNPLKKDVTKNSGGEAPINYINLRSYITGEDISISQMVDMFYYGYVVNKEREQSVHASFSICKKLFKEEFKHLNNKREGKRVLDVLNSPESHRTDLPLLKWFLKMFDGIAQRKIAPNYKEVMEKSILIAFSRSTFSTLATLKASAKDHSVNYPAIQGGNQSFRETIAFLRTNMPNEYRRRPKTLESISLLAAEFEGTEGIKLEELFQLIPYCLDSLESKDGFDSDLFSKSQHGGDREIHVLEIKARVVQYFLETISKTICTFFPSETTVNAHEKEKFVNKHYKRCSVTFNEFLTLSKSADAKTWCQNHHVSRFAVMLIALTHKTFHSFIYRTLYLWTRKKVSIPADLVALFLSNQTTISGDSTFVEMRRRFYEGELPFLKAGDGKAQISGGMFQGIYHRTSSLYHVVIQDVMENVEIEFFKRLTGSTMVVTKKVGSDDSVSMNSFALTKNSKEHLKIAYRLIGWKEILAEYLAVFNSKAKTVRGIIDLLEYNSEWYVRTRSIKPTFRWVSACMETTVVESFITRYRIFSNTLTQVIEGGSPTLAASLIQLCQGLLHYKLLGSGTSSLFPAASEKLLCFPDPALGFFPLDPDITAGLLGLDFNMYCIAKKSGYGHHLATIESNAENPILDYEGKRGESFRKSSSRTRLQFGVTNLWDVIKSSVNGEELDEIIAMVDADPLLIYGSHKSWKDDRISILLKLYSPGVKASLNNRNSLIRMQVASAYILRCACFVDPGDPMNRKTLIQLLDSQLETAVKVENVDEYLQVIFPLIAQYEELRVFVEYTTKKMFYSPADYKMRNKATIEIYHSIIPGKFALIDICKRKWFGAKHSLPLGETSFNQIWIDTKEEFKFLRDTHDETRAFTGMNTVSLKYFLESVISKERKVRLNDTSAKGSSVFNTITRILWPNVKLRTPEDLSRKSSIRSLRSSLFCIMNYFFSQNIQDEMVKDLIVSSDVLDDKKMRVSPLGKNLKLMKDYITGKRSKISVLEEIKSTRGGSVGYFSIRQEFGLNKRRKGPGQWRGIINECHVIIDIEDSDCVQITANRIFDADHLGKQLKQILREMNVNISSARFSPNNVYLVEGGKLVVFPEAPSIGVPVVVNNSTKVSVMEKLLSYDWRITCNEYSIKLQLHQGGSPDITVLSEFITRRDWDPTLEEINSENILFSHFQKGRSVPMRDWVLFSREYLPEFHHRRLGVYDLAAKGKSFNGIDPSKLRAMLLRVWGSRKTMNEEILGLLHHTESAEIHMDNIEEAIDRMMFSVPNMEPIKDLTMMMALGPVLSEKEMRQQSILTGGFVSEDAMETFLTMFEDTDIDIVEKQEIQMLTLKGMPTTNAFFNELIKTTVMTQPNLTYEQLSSGSLIEIEGLHGRILSLIFGRDLEAKWSYELERGDVPYEEHSTQVSSISVDSNISLRQLAQDILAIEDSLKSAEGIVKRMLLKQLRKEQDLMERMKISMEIHDMDNSPLEVVNKKIFVTDIMKYRSRDYDDFGDLMCPEDEELYTLTNSRLRSIVNGLFDNDDIDENTVAIYKQAISSRDFTEEYAYLLTNGLQFELKIYYGDKLLIHQIPRVNEDGVGLRYTIVPGSTNLIDMYDTINLSHEITEEDDDTKSHGSEEFTPRLPTEEEGEWEGDALMTSSMRTIKRPVSDNGFSDEGKEPSAEKDPEEPVYNTKSIEEQLQEIDFMSTDESTVLTAYDLESRKADEERKEKETRQMIQLENELRAKTDYDARIGDTNEENVNLIRNEIRAQKLEMGIAILRADRKPGMAKMAKITLQNHMPKQDMFNWQETSGENAECLIHALVQATNLPYQVIKSQAMTLFRRGIASLGPDVLNELGVTLDNFFNIDIVLCLPCFRGFSLYILTNGDPIIIDRGRNWIVIRNIDNVHYENAVRDDVFEERVEYMNVILQDISRRYKSGVSDEVRVRKIGELEEELSKLQRCKISRNQTTGAYWLDE